MDQTAKINWERVETVIRTLYLEQDLSLPKLMKEMEEKYDFKATKYQYESQFKKWDIRKYRTAQEWRIVSQKVTKRKREQKETEVILNGISINSKKLRKEILRHRPSLIQSKTSQEEQSPSTPEGFIIRTPPPVVIATSPLSTEFCRSHHQPPHMRHFVLNSLPFNQVNSSLNRIDMPFISSLENGSWDSVHSSEPIQSSVLKALARSNGDDISISCGGIIQAVLPDDLFPRDNTVPSLAISHQEPSSNLQFLKLTIYLISNNFLPSTEGITKKVYRWIKRSVNAGLMEYLLSIGGPTVEALIESLFRLSIYEGDYRTVKLLIRLGVNPNEQMNWENGYAPLHIACQLQNLELVKVLIDGGAKVDIAIDHESFQSDLLAAFRLCNPIFAPKVNPELVQLLVDAGASVNPGLGQSPLAKAVESRQVQVVNILVSAGADVNYCIGNGWSTTTPLIAAVRLQREIAETDVMAMVRVLLNAGADCQAVATWEGEITTILEAAMYGDSFQLIELLLQNGARVTEGAFVRAVSKCSAEIVKLMLTFGGQVTERVIKCAVERDSELMFFLLDTTDRGNNAICKTAALIKSIECLNMGLILRLGEDGARLKKGPELANAIQKVAQAGNIDILHFLLDEKSGYRAKSLEYLDAALLTAVQYDRHNIVELLLTSGATPNNKRYHLPLENNPLLAAIKNKNLCLAKRLLDVGAAVNADKSIDEFNTYTTTVLPAVVEWGNYSLLQDVIDAGAEIDAPEELNGDNGLYIAVKKRDAQSIKFLIDAGANINASATTISGNTALKAACELNDLEMVRYLLNLGADPDEWSLLTAISGRVDLVQAILAARLRRYKTYSKGWGCGALQYAIRLKNVAMVSLLLTEGIDSNRIIRSKLGNTILTLSFSPIHYFHPMLVTGESALGSAIKCDTNEDPWIVEMLLGGGANPNSIVNSDNQTALLLAIDQNKPALVKVLIAAGAVVSPILRYGIERTPLQLAVQKGRLGIVNILLDNGADINAPPYDRYGATALQFAAIHGYIGTAQLLLQRGADINALPAKIGGRTALEAAAEYGRIDMLHFFLSAGALTFGTGLSQYNNARELALKNGHRAACRMLEKHNMDLMEITEPWEDLGMGI
ncbi:ankyrin repeat-containing domain protein [Bisporella sp. PMI_857]|nr:ankyrin repeat-containing domain protein [Bisporella sp. PMI_857]